MRSDQRSWQQQTHEVYEDVKACTNSVELNTEQNVYGNHFFDMKKNEREIAQVKDSMDVSQCNKTIR